MVRTALAMAVVLALGGGCKGAESTAAADTKPTVAPGTKPAAAPAGVAITVDAKGFTPSSVSFKKGDRGALIFTRTTDDTCAKEVVFPELNLKKELPLKTPVALEVPTDNARTLTFQCGMGMFKSSVVIQ